MLDKEIEKAYKESEDFKLYVDSYAECRRKSIHDALRDEVVALVYKHYVQNKQI